MESPASRYSMKVWMGTRVPEKTGVPPMTSGEIVTMGVFMMFQITPGSSGAARLGRSVKAVNEEGGEGSLAWRCWLLNETTRLHPRRFYGSYRFENGR